MNISTTFQGVSKIMGKETLLFKFLWIVKAAGVAQSVLHLATYWTIVVWSPAGAKNFSSSPSVKTTTGAHPAPYPVGTGGGSFPQG
jgi:hypothetical protein